MLGGGALISALNATLKFAKKLRASLVFDLQSGRYWFHIFNFALDLTKSFNFYKTNRSSVIEVVYFRNDFTILSFLQHTT